MFATFRGEGDTRLFLHCSLSHHQSLMTLAHALPPARNVFFDLPGHGHSAEWQGEEYQTDAMRIAEALLDGPTHVAGHSFGATVALRLAVERPDLVSRLTLIEPVMFAAVQDAEARNDPRLMAEPKARVPRGSSGVVMTRPRTRSGRHPHRRTRRTSHRPTGPAPVRRPARQVTP